MGSYAGFAYGARRYKQGNREGGARLSLSSKNSDGGLKLDAACVQKQLICFYQDQEKNQYNRGCQKCTPFTATVWFLFTFLPYVAKSVVYSHCLALFLNRKYLASLMHLRFFHLNHDKYLSFISFPVSLATCKDTPEKQCQATPSV